MTFMTKLINSWPKLKTEAILAKAILTRNTRKKKEKFDFVLTKQQ